VTYGLVSAFVILFASVAAPAERRWPGAAPDCWADARFFIARICWTFGRIER
jgi:hypothetical protein